MKGFIDGKDWVNVEPMKYWSAPASYSLEKKKNEVISAVFSGQFMGALKVDGYYQRIIKDEDGNIFMIARNRNVNGEVVDKHEWVPHLNPFFEAIPNGTCFLCECYLPGNEGSKNITSILGCLKDKAIARQEKTPLHLYIFDIMAFNGHNYNKMGYEDRAQALRRCAEASLYQSPYVEWAEFFEGEELWTKLQEYLASGREGMVIMRKDAQVYEKRTPAHISIKVKKELQETLDVVVMGANPPTRVYGGKEIESWKYWENLLTGEKLCGDYFLQYTSGESYEPITKMHYLGGAGSLIIGAYKDGKCIPVGNLSGLEEEVLLNWKDYVGKVAEITAMEVMRETKGLRHPRMMGWRADKPAKDCDWYKIFGEE